MKRLLVLMLCGMLMVPSLGVQAASEQNEINIDSQGTAVTSAEGSVGGSATDDEDPNSAEKVTAAKEKALKDLNDYYLITKILKLQLNN